MQAYDTARYIGLKDRGAVATGQRADLNIIDYDALETGLANVPVALATLVAATGSVFFWIAGGTLREDLASRDA